MDIKILLSVIAAGIPGLFSYSILDKFSLVNYTDKNNYEKTLLVTSLSGFNVVMSFITLLYLKINLSLITPENLLKILVVSFFITMILSIILYPLLFWFLRTIIKKLENRINMQSNLKTFPRLLENAPADTKNIYVYIYDLNDKYISSGAIGVYSKFDLEFSLIGQPDRKEIQEVLKLYKEYEYRYRHNYINLEKNFNMFIFYQV